MLYNIVGNSIKFTFKGFVNIRASMVNDILLTEVIDSGIGIKKEDVEKLFKFFGKLSTSSKINQGGMGFGLTISKMII